MSGRISRLSLSLKNTQDIPKNTNNNMKKTHKTYGSDSVFIRACHHLQFRLSRLCHDHILKATLEPFVPMLSWLRVRIVTFHRHQIASSVIIHLLPSLAPLGYGFSVPLHGLSIGCGYLRKALSRPLPIFF